MNVIWNAPTEEDELMLVLSGRSTGGPVYIITDEMLKDIRSRTGEGPLTVKEFLSDSYYLEGSYLFGSKLSKHFIVFYNMDGTASVYRK
jgi:hypothetical protein